MFVEQTTNFPVIMSVLTKLCDVVASNVSGITEVWGDHIQDDVVEVFEELDMSSPDHWQQLVEDLAQCHDKEFLECCVYTYLHQICYEYYKHHEEGLDGPENTNVRVEHWEFLVKEQPQEWMKCIDGVFYVIEKEAQWMIANIGSG